MSPEYIGKVVVLINISLYLGKYPPCFNHRGEQFFINYIKKLVVRFG